MIKSMLEECQHIPDIQWGFYALKRDLLYQKMPEDKKDYIKKAMECGQNQGRKIKTELPDLNPSAIADKLGLRIIEERPFAMKGYYLFAEFREPDTIVLYPTVIAEAENLAVEKNIHFLHLPLAEHLIAHEVFHYIEMQQPALYTNAKPVELKTVLPWKRKSNIRALSEIAGMAFVKTVLGLSYSPFLLDILLLYPKEPDTASALYREITEMDHTLHL